MLRQERTGLRPGSGSAIRCGSEDVAGGPMLRAERRIVMRQMASPASARSFAAASRARARGAAGADARTDASGLVERLGVEPSELSSALKAVERGFAFSAVRRLQKATALSLREVGELIRVAPRTMVRRRETGRLEPAESDRLLRVARVVDAATRLFDGDENEAREWLLRPLEALSGARPVDLMKTEVGSREVEALIGRLEHGVFS